VPSSNSNSSKRKKLPSLSKTPSSTVPSPLKEELNEDESDDEETNNRTPKSRSNNMQGSKGSNARSLSKEALPPKSPKLERKR